MTVTDNVFPQSGDADFAENFATWLGRGNISNFVETGLQFTVDYANDTLTVSQGKAFVVIDQSTISSNSETRLVLDYAVTVSEKTGVALNANESNNLIYLNPNIGTNDSPSIEVETTTGAAGSDWLRIGTVDTSSDSYTTENREPSADFTTLATLDTLNVPVYSNTADASSSESSVVYIDGSESESSGLYVHDGSSYISAGVREIDKLNDVTGVASLTADSASNRPAAGTEGRVFIDETNNAIQFDNGSSWNDIGTNPSNIGAGDLGFNTATQAELDAHESTSDAHHTRPTAGNGLKDQSNTFNFEPAEVAGLFVEDDGSDNIAVQIGRGLEDDGSGQIQFDEDINYSFTAGIDAQGDITDGSQVIWDVSAQEIPDSALGNIDNTTLTNSNITVNAGNKLTGGGNVALGGSVDLDVDESALDSEFLNTAGDVLEGVLDANSNASGRIVLPVGTDQYAT